MTRRRTFMGFLVGTAATIAFRAVGQTAQASVGSGGGTVSITPFRSEGTAPAGNIYEVSATGMTGRSYQDVYYKWTFDDPITLDNLPSDWPWSRENVSTSYGPVVSWVHRAVGTRTVRCDAWDILTGNYLGFDTITFTATDLDATFPTKMCIGTNSADMPAGASGPYSDFNSALDSVGGSGKVQFLFERGVDHQPNSTDGRVRTSDAQSVYFGAYGPSASRAGAIVPWFDGQTGEIIVDGVDMIKSFDPGDPGGSIATSSGKAFGSTILPSHSATFFTFWDCEISGMSKLTCKGRMVIGNSTIRDWADYGIFFDKDTTGVEGWFGAIGLDLRQANDAVIMPSDGQKYANTGQPSFPIHGPWRMSNPEAPVCFDMCRIVSTNGWGAIPHPQPLIRWGEDASPERDMKLNISRVIGEGPGFLGQPSSGNAGLGADVAPQQVVIDKVHFTNMFGGIGTGTKQGLTICYAGQTVRNYIGVIPDIPLPTSYTQSDDVEQFVRIGAEYPISEDQDVANDGNYNIYGNENGPFELYGYTLLDQRSTANLGGRSFEAIYKVNAVPDDADIRIANGYHWSNDASGADYRKSTDTLTAAATWTPYITQTRQATDRNTLPTILTDTAHRTTVEAAQVWAPAAPTGVDASGDTMSLEGDTTTVVSHELLPLDDFFGNARSGSYKGAVDPAATRIFPL